MDRIKFQEKQVIKDHCCTGFDWEIRYIMNEETVWGKCLNPNCPDVCRCGGCGELSCMWDGVGFFDIDDYYEVENG